jgi:hypothetical protein
MKAENGEIPQNWDALTDRAPSPEDPGHPLPDRSDHGFGPPVLSLMAASWADLVSMLAVCTCALVAILALGEQPTTPAFGWAIALSAAWWVFAASVLVVVRQGTPGMLLAGVSFDRPVLPPRVVWVLAAALVGVLSLGLTGVLGSRRSILAVAAESEIVSAVP